MLTNGISQSLARRDKWVMGETVRQAGLRSVNQIEVRGGGFTEASRFIERQKDSTTGEFSVVLKPAASAGSEGVFFATTMADAEMYFNQIYGQRNVFGEVSERSP